MSKRLLLLWTGLFILLCLIGGWFYLDSQADQTEYAEKAPLTVHSSSTPQQPESPALNEQTIEKPQARSEIKPATTDVSDKQPKPLNLNLDSTPETVATPPSIEGPVQPSSSEKGAVQEEDSLPLKGTAPKDKLLYGYEGKDKDDNVNLMLGVQKDDITIKSGVKKGDDETEVQSIEIEVKLPK